MWRSERVGSLYAWFADGRKGRVTATVDALLRAGLLSLDLSDRHRPTAVPTPAGRALLGHGPKSTPPD